MANQTTLRRQRSTPRRSARSIPSRRGTRSRPAASRRKAARSPRSSRSPSRSSPSPPRRTTRKSPARRRPVPGERGIQAFFDGFTQELTAGDGRSVAARFEYPSLMVMSAVGNYGGSQPIPDAAQAAEFFDRAPEQYHAKGIEGTFAHIQDVQWLSHDLALVRVHFPYIDADGNDLGDGETSLYIVRRQGQQRPGYAICAAITLGTDGDQPARRPGRGSRASTR